MLGMDRLSPQDRSRNMRAIRGKDTKPEVAVRRLLHAAGYRFRLHGAGIPGRPDVVFASRRKVIFVHGCFWHRHKGCRFTYTPKSRIEFWQAKFDQNVARDRRIEAQLRDRGWQYLVLWECEVAAAKVLLIRVAAFLGDPCAGKSCRRTGATLSARRSSD